MSDLLVVAQITRENVSLPATSDKIVLIVIHLQEEEWIADVNAFIQEEDDESYIYNVRTSVNDLLGVSCRTGLLLQNLMNYPFGSQSLLDKYTQPVAKTFGQAVQQRLLQADQMRQAGNSDW